MQMTGHLLILDCQRFCEYLHINIFILFIQEILANSLYSLNINAILVVLYNNAKDPQSSSAVLSGKRSKLYGAIDSTNEGKTTVTRTKTITIIRNHADG